jgi:exosortase K
VSTRPRNWRVAPATAAAIAVALAGAYLLKRHYSGASPDDLAWILAPTAHLVSLLTGADFVAERGAGYTSNGLLFVIGPSCAGVNFLIALFCAGAIGLVPQARGAGRTLVALAGCAAAAYLATIAVNALRIVVAIELHQRQTRIAGLSGDELHRVEGIVVYFTALMLIYLAAFTLWQRRARALA